MANVEKLQGHLKKAKSNLAEASKKGDDAAAIRKLKKKPNGWHANQTKSPPWKKWPN